MDKESKNLKNRIHGIIWLLVIIAIVYLISQNLNTALYIMVVALGFGAVIMIHEFGHFVVAKSSGIQVDSFSIGFPPVLIGIKRIEEGVRIRLLPTLVNKNKENPEEGGYVFVVGKKGKPWDTEYRICLIPFGGYVAMMGQSDSGVVEKTDDPRSFLNKPIWVRITLAAAGVTFNAISAVIIFMAVFLAGFDMAPAEVGGVVANSPADIAGILPGDRIEEINGEKFIDFMSLPLAATVSKKDEEVNLVVKRPDGHGGFEDPLKFSLVAKVPARAALPVRALGIAQASTLKITDKLPEEIEKELYSTTGLKSGDLVTAVNGVKIEKGWQLNDLVAGILEDHVTLTVKREAKGEVVNPNVDVPLYVRAENDNFETGYDLAHIHTMVPRLKISKVFDQSSTDTWQKKVMLWWRRTVLRQDITSESEKGETDILKKGDIIVKIAEQENPTYAQLRDITENHKDKPMVLRVLRKDQTGTEKEIAVTVTPRQQFTRNGDGPVTIGIDPVLDIEHPVVAKTIDIENGLTRLDIPSGAKIVAVDGEKVSSFYDVIRIIRHNRGQRINLDYRLDAQNAGAVLLEIPSGYDFITAKTDIKAFQVGKVYYTIPFKMLQERYKANGPIEAVSMGIKKTNGFIVHSCIMLRRLITRDVSPKVLSGPLGIVTASYSVAQESMSYYFYLLGLISSCIAVMNLLPLPILDGGVIVLLIIEKIKGGPLSLKVQAAIQYVGLVLILAFFVWVFYNDFLNMLLQ